MPSLRATGSRAALAVLVPVLLTTLLPGCSSSSSSGSSSSGSPASSSSGAPSGSPAGSTGGSGAAAPGSAATAGGSASPLPEPGARFPVTVQAGNGPVTVAARPKRIVSLAPSLTEVLFAIGAGSQVVAVDDLSNYPAGAPRTKLSGFQPNVEAVAGYTPDLVVVSNDVGGLVASLTRLKVPVLLLGAPATLEGSYAQQLVLGSATGHPALAQQVAAETRRRIDAAVAAVPKSDRPVKVYHEVDQTYYSVNSQTFLGDVYKKFGLTNIADGATKPSGGYPQLSAEYVISSAPDLIVLADGKCCQQNPRSVAARPAFAGLPAVRNGRVISVDDDLASRWGPRAADFADQVARALGAKI